MEYMFPFKLVPYGSRIVIYGAGQVGQEYFLQIRETGYAKVICFIDMQADRYQGMRVKVCYPNDINNFAFDYVIVALKDDTYVPDVINNLIQLGIPMEKLIYQLYRWPKLEMVLDLNNCVSRNSLAVDINNAVPIAVSIAGGIGDCIVRKRQLEELMSWNESIVVDVFTVPKRKELLRWLFSNDLQVHTVVGNRTQLNYLKGDYAAVLEFGYSLNIIAWNPEKFYYFPDLLKKMRQIEVAVGDYGNIDNSALMAVEFHRAEKDGLNFYTSYNRYGAFNITDWRTQIILTYEDESCWQKLYLDKSEYITISCGCDMAVGHKELQAKTWPFSYWTELVSILHEQLPGITIIQVDGAGVTRVPECNAYVIGEDIKVAAQALRGAKVHIDNEGGLVHLATQLGTRCVVLFGPTPVSYYGYKENINLQEGECQNCYWLAGNPSLCYRRMDEPKCMYSIRPDRVAVEVVNCLEDRSEEK